jgi:integrase
MPHLRQRADGRYFIDDHIDGHRVRSPLQTLEGRPVRDAALAGAMFRDYLEKQRPGIVAEVYGVGPAEADPHIRDLVQFYIDDHLRARNSAPKTFTQASEHLDKFKDFCRSRNVGRASQLTPRTVTDFTNYLAGKKLHPKTVKNHLMTLRACLNAAVGADMLPESPVRRWLFPTTEDTERTPLDAGTLGLLLRLLRTAPDDLRRIVTHIATTGNRPSDACTLRWDRVDLERGYVSRVSVKSRALREYPLTPDALENIRDAAKARQGDLVFPRADGRPWTVHSAYRQFTRFITAERAAGRFPRYCNLKDLRHTFGTIAANEPVALPLPVVQAMMGHSDITTTMQYVLPTAATGALRRFSDLLAGAALKSQTTEQTVAK